MEKDVFKSEWEAVTKIAVRIIRYNNSLSWGGAWGVEGAQICHDAFKLGFDVREGWNRELFVFSGNGDNAPLENVLEALTKSKKARTTPIGDRRRRKEAERNAGWYNVRRYNTRFLPASDTAIQTQAQSLRHLKIAVRHQKAADITYWANVVADWDNKRKDELLARMNYPEQITLDLRGELTESYLHFLENLDD